MATEIHEIGNKDFPTPPGQELSDKLSIPIPPENFTQSKPLPKIYSLLKLDEHLSPTEATSLEEETTKYHNPDWLSLPTLEACLPPYPSVLSVVSLTAPVLQPSLAQDLIS